MEKFGERDWEGAKSKFQKVIEIFPNDKPTKIYLDECEAKIVIPPPEDWSPVFNLQSK